VFRSLKSSGALIGLVTALVVVASPAFAVTTVSNTPAASWRLNGRVYASVIVGNEIILGGEFTQATSPDGQTVVPRAHLAAFQLSTGNLITTFQADANNTVRALVSDGSTVWVGGLFTHLGTVNRTRLATISPAGIVQPGFTPAANAAVLGLDLRAGRLFVGGDFTTLGGQPRSRAGAVDPVTGVLDPTFAPVADNRVAGIRANPTGTTVYLAGTFTHVNTTARAGFAAVTGTTGATTGPAFANSIAPALGLDMNADGTVLYGAEGAQGTDANNADAWNVTTGARIWHIRTDGDIQAIRYQGDDVFFGFHDGYQLDGVTKLLAVNAVTGALDTTFRPVFNMFYGVFTIAVSDNWVVAGGEFTRVSGGVAGYWARFPITSAAPPVNQPPTASFTSAVAPDGTATFNGSGSSDSDGNIVSYAWVFGDNSSGTGVSPTHVYTADGHYSVTLTVTDNGGASTSTTQPVDVSISTVTPVDTVVVAKGTSWAWRYATGAPDAGWNARTFDASGWNQGNAPLGFGTTSLGTNIDTFATTASRPLAAYYTKSFQVTDTSKVTKLMLNTVADDGVVVYVNGTEVARSNMANGTVTPTTYATAAPRTTAANNAPVTITVPTSLLVNGTNTVSAETHLNYHATPDLSYDLGATLTTVG
jgi:PKD repeat protein